MDAGRSVGWVRRWVGLYTRGLPAGLRRDRIDEIEDDLWSQLHDKSEPGGGRDGLRGEILARLVFGIPADLAWRLEQRGVSRAPRPAPERSPTMFARFIAAMAIVGGVAWAIWSVPTAIGGWAAWGMQPIGYFIYPTALLGSFALGIATFGLVFANIDRINTVAGAMGAVGGGGGLLLTLSVPAGIVLLPIGSAALMLGLLRLDCLSGRHAWLHAAAGTALALSPLAVNISYPQGTELTLLCLGALAYGLTWLAIGWSLRSGEWMPREPAASRP
jgi:hypothetical protein